MQRCRIRAVRSSCPLRVCPSQRRLLQQLPLLRGFSRLLVPLQHQHCQQPLRLQDQQRQHQQKQPQEQQLREGQQQPQEQQQQQSLQQCRRQQQQKHLESSSAGFTASWGKRDFSSTSSPSMAHRYPLVCPSLFPYFCTNRLPAAAADTGRDRGGHLAAAAVSPADAVVSRAALAQGFAEEASLSAAAAPATSKSACTSAASDGRKPSVLRTCRSSRLKNTTSSGCCDDGSWSSFVTRPRSSRTSFCSSSCCCYNSTICCINCHTPHRNSISRWQSTITFTCCSSSSSTYMRHSDAVRGNCSRRRNSSRCCSSSSSGSCTRDTTAGLSPRFNSGHCCSSGDGDFCRSTQDRSSSTQDCSRWPPTIRSRSLWTIGHLSESRRHPRGFSRHAICDRMQSSNNVEFRSLVSSPACSNRSACSSRRYICSSSSRSAWGSRSSACSGRRAACGSSTGPVCYSNCNNVAGRVVAVACRSSSVRINSSNTRKSTQCCSSEDSGTSRHQFFGRFNKMKQKISSNVTNMKSCWDVDNSSLDSTVGNTSAPDFTCSSLVIRSHEYSSRSRSDLFKEPVAAAAVWGASTCVSPCHRRTHILEAGSHSAAEKVGHSQQAFVPSATICCRTLVHALVLKQQQQQQPQEQQNVYFLPSRGSLTNCEAVGAAVLDAAVNSSHSATAAGEQQEPSSPNEDSAAAAPAVVSAPSAAASTLLQVQATQAAARATAQRGLIFPSFITGDQEQQLHQQLHLEALENYAQPQLRRETCVSGGDETPLLAQERLTREPLPSMQEADQQQHQQIEEERGEEQEKENLREHHSSRLPWMIPQQRSPLVGEELLRSIRQLPWARRLTASLDSAAVAKAMPRVLPATEAVEAAARPAEEAAAGEAAPAGGESSKAVLVRGAAIAERRRSADAASHTRRSRTVLDATTPAGVSAATPTCSRTAAKLEAAEAAASAVAEADSAAAEAGNFAAAQAGDSAAAAVPADTAAAAGGHIDSTASAAALERAVDSAADWWARQAPRYLGPVIKRISRRPADVQLRLIQLALTYTPLQEEICPPQRHQLQQQAQSMRLHCGGDVVRKKRQQQDVLRMQKQHHGGIACSANKKVSACGREEARVEEPAAAASKEDYFSTGADAADIAAGFETGFVSAGVKHLTEDDVIIFGAPFLWFTQHPRLPLLQRLWCVEQLAFWLHASGRPSALRHLHKPQRQKKQDRQTAMQQQHQRMHISKERHNEKKVQHNTSIIQPAKDSPTSATGDPKEEDAAFPLNEGCFQVSPQGDLQISDIRVWRSIGVAIRFLLHEGYLDCAAHMLYSMLSLLYDARAFPAPAPATSSSSVPQAKSCSLTLASIRLEAAAQWTRVNPASRPVAQGTAAVVAAEITGSGGTREMLPSTAGSAGGMPCVPEAAAVATQATPLARVDDLPIASAIDDARLPSFTGFPVAEDTHAPTGGATLRSRASLGETGIAAGVPAAAVLATAASASERFTGGSVLTAPAISLAAGSREPAPFLTTPSTQDFIQRKTFQENIIKENGDSSSPQRTQNKGLTEDLKENCGFGSSSGPSKLMSEKMGGPVTACKDTMGRSRTPLFLFPEKRSGGSRSAQHSVKDSIGDSSSAVVSQAAAESTSACLARHLGLTRWSMSKPVWLKLLARRRCVALAAEDTEAPANVGSPAGDPPPLQQHELEAVTLLESLFFTFHDEVRCAATVMSEALEKQQQAAGRTAGIAAQENKGGSAGGSTALFHSVSVCNAVSTATSKRLVERFTAARHTGECHMQQYLRRMRVIKMADHSGAAEENEQQQRPESHDSSWRDRIQRKRKAGDRRWVAVLVPTSEPHLQTTTETSISQRQTEKSTFFSCAERGTSFSLHSYMMHTPARSDSSIPAAGGPMAATTGKQDPTAAPAQPSRIAAETFGLRTLVWYLRLQSHFYKVQNVAMTTFVCQLLTRLLRLCELQRLYPAESRRTESSSGASRLACSTNAASAIVNPLSLFAKRETLPLPFSPAGTAMRPPQDGVIVSRVAPSARGATVAAPAAVLLAQILAAVKAVHFYDHELLHACCEALRPNVCLLPPQYACGVIFNLGCLGYSDPALASSVAHFLVDSGLLKKDTNVDAMMQLLIGFSRLDFRDDRLTSACIDALMAVPDVLSFTCRPVSLFYLLHSISFHNVRCLPLLVRLLPALQHYAAIVPTNVAVLTFHDLIRNSVWPGPYRRLLIPRLLKELSSLAVATLAGATPLCWSLWGHFDVPLLLRLAQQFNTTRSVRRSTVSTGGLLSQPQRNGDLSQPISKAADRVSGCGVTAERDSDSDAQSARIFSQCEEQGGSNEERLRGGDASTTLTLVKASTQFWSAFYCVQLLGLTPRDFLPHAHALDKKYMRGGFKHAKRQRRAKKASSDRNASASVQPIRPQRHTSHFSFASSYALNEKNDVAGKPQFTAASPASVYFASPHFSSCPNVRFSPWQAGSLAGLKAAQILQTPEANWTPKSSTLHEEVLAACPHKVRAAAINEQPAGPYEVDLVVPPGALASAHADLAQRRKRP